MNTAAYSPLPSGRGREAMTYGRVGQGRQEQITHVAVVSHLAELVRGEFGDEKAPSSAPSGHLLPKGRRAVAATEGTYRGLRT
jgi:hypothetical protein